LEGGPGADYLQGDLSGRSGTPGGDFLSGGEGKDQFVGSGGDDTIYGGPGDDTIDDSLGNDTIDGGDDSDTCKQGDAPNGADVIFDDGGSGTDVVDYSQRPSGSIGHVTPQAAEDGYANDGGSGEADNIQSGIETINGPA